MIKWIACVTKRQGLSDAEFAARSLRHLQFACAARREAQPLRAVACTALRDLAGPSTPHDGIWMAWFEDLDALRRFESSLGAGATIVEPDTTRTIAAEEVAMRGADWLTQRWADGGVKLKHMALARRASGLTPAQFSERWRGHAGRLGSTRAPVIPDQAKGLAYIQNHPLTRSEEWAYDAINEVYFDDLASMRARIAFFAENDAPRAAADLVSESAFVAVTEHVVSVAGPG